MDADAPFDNPCFGMSFDISALPSSKPNSPKEWVVRNNWEWTGPAPAPTRLTEDILRASEGSRGFIDDYKARKKRRPAPLLEVPISPPLQGQYGQNASLCSPMPDRPERKDDGLPPSPRQWAVRNVWEWTGPAPAMRPLEDLAVLRATTCSDGFFKELAARCAQEYEAMAGQLVKREV